MSRFSRFLFVVVFVALAAIQLVSAEELYVVGFGTNAVYYVVTNGSKVAAIAMDGNPFDVVATTDGAYVYVSRSTANSVAVIRTADNVVVQVIGTPSSPAKKPSPKTTPKNTTKAANSKYASCSLTEAARHSTTCALLTRSLLWHT